MSTPSPASVAVPAALAVLYEDANLLVVHKPVGMASQGPGEPNLVDWLRSRAGREYAGLVHRLDREVSGVMVLARRSKAARRLTESLREGELRRSYLGWIDGTLEREERWEDWLAKDARTNVSRVVRMGSPGAKLATLLASPVERAPGPRQLARFQLETGRSHQIRVQCASRGRPLVGDARYGGERGQRLLLHCDRLEFPHPVGGQTMIFHAARPAGFRPGPH